MRTLDYEQLKAKRELEIFSAFADICPLNLDLSSARKEDPPLPDVYCEIEGRPHYFELGRVFDENSAKRRAHTEKTRKITAGAFSQDRPLIQILKKKAAKTYKTGPDADPVGKESLDLVIYYDEQVPLPKALYPETRRELLLLVRDMTLLGQFNRIWFYNHHRRRIMDFHPGIAGP